MAEAANSILRECKHCKVTKPLESFGKHQQWRVHKCKSCDSADRRERYAKRLGQFAAVGSDEWKRKALANSRNLRGRYVWEPSWLKDLPTKTCTRCRIELPANPAWFQPVTKAKTGLSSWCRPCVARDYDENKAKRTAGQREYWVRRMASDPERIRSNRRRWQEANPDKKKASERRWRDENVDQARADAKVRENKRRALKRGSDGSFHRDDIAHLLVKQKRKCWYCLKKMSAYHIEHRIPLSRGGSNNLENIVLACPPCNWSKGAKMPWEMAVPRLF